MGKADDLKARFAEDLAIAELEDELVRLKPEPGDACPTCGRRQQPSPGDDKKLRKVKDQLRQARFEQRTAREGNG